MDDWPGMLREARERAELTRTALAERSRLAARTIKSYESGHGTLLASI